MTPTRWRPLACSMEFHTSLAQPNDLATASFWFRHEFLFATASSVACRERGNPGVNRALVDNNNQTSRRVSALPGHLWHRQNRPAHWRRSVLPTRARQSAGRSLEHGSIRHRRQRHPSLDFNRFVGWRVTSQAAVVRRVESLQYLAVDVSIEQQIAHNTASLSLCRQHASTRPSTYDIKPGAESGFGLVRFLVGGLPRYTRVPQVRSTAGTTCQPGGVYGRPRKRRMHLRHAKY